MTACTPSCARWPTTSPSADVNVKLIARNNEVLGTAKTDARGYAKFDAGLARGEGGLQPAHARGRKRQRRVRLPRSHLGRLRPDRPRRQRAARRRARSTASSTPSAASIAPARTCTSPPSCAMPPARPPRLPVTLIVTRPDGVEHSRYALKDRGLGGRDITLPLAASSQTGTWRAKLHTDPRQGSDHAGVVPGRGLRPRAPRPQARAAGGCAVAAGDADHQGHRALSLRPAGRRPRHRRRHRRQALDQGRCRLPRLPVRPGRRDHRAGAQAARRRDQSPTRKASPRLPLRCRPSRRRPSRSKPTSSCACAKSGGRTIERSITIPVDLKQARIGIKPLFKGTDLDEKQTASFEVVVLDAEGKRVAADGLDLGAQPPRHQLAVVPPRRPVELRGRDAHPQDRRRRA